MATLANRYLAKAVKIGRRLSGSEATTWVNRNSVIKTIAEKKITPLRAQRKAYVEPIRTSQARAKLAIGATTAVTTGFLGTHKYHQHKDNEIMKRIDKMYKPD